MRILLITDMIPYPPISGTPLRTYNLLQRVSKEHEVWLATFVNPNSPGTPEAIAHIQSLCKHVETVNTKHFRALSRPVEMLRYLLSGTPPDLRAYHSDELVQKIQRLTSEVDFDAVEIVDSFLAKYFEALPPSLHSKTVLTYIDIVFDKYDRIYQLEPRLKRKVRLWLHSRMMRWWEPRYPTRFGRCIAMSNRDRDVLASANPRLHIDVVPNGVDTQAYQPLPHDENAPPSLVFVGNMGYRPNIDGMIFFCHEVLPLIRQEVPDTALWIVGVNPEPEVEALAGDGVHVTGRVEDLRPYYQQSSVSIVPLRAGGGTRLKILEAMALGRPVVSTFIGCEGIDVTDGEDIFIADDAATFAEKTIQLLNDAALRQRIATRGRALVETQYDWKVIAQKLVQIYAELAS